ncbi:hypothetical protein [Neolewinella agarilytica]|uniref:Uncharacterized protein n=1 Tax=Neolewinella agarilytica TaxID=478744 RepID=A0A1H9I2U7_9BACT|nr:hypothetical protein [Neolewinella agarilytica]SEQ68822.1 hypothetical protein SAMN05444359_11413 [Neolewinella agarilytica]
MEGLVSEKAIRVADVLEQIDSVNRMISIHTDDEFMKSQYEFRRRNFMEELKTYLGEFDVQLKDVAA